MATVVLAAQLVGVDGLTEGSGLVHSLGNPAERDVAYCRLVELGMYRNSPRYKQKRCNEETLVNHVVMAPQQSGGSMAVVFKKPGYDAPETGLGRPKGPFVLFENDGHIVPVFAGANLLREDDAVFSHRGDRRLVVAHLIHHGSGRDGPSDWTIQALHIVPVTPEQASALTVIVGPPTFGFDDVCEGFYWNWRTQDIDSDGIPEVEIGPMINTDGDIDPRVVYRWSDEAGGYEGPDGSIDEGFLRLDKHQIVGDRNWYRDLMDWFSLGRLAMGNPGDPSAVRRGKCHSSSSWGPRNPR